MCGVYVDCFDQVVEGEYGVCMFVYLDWLVVVDQVYYLFNEYFDGGWVVIEGGGCGFQLGDVVVMVGVEYVDV